jgi:hypothetical protein
MDARSRAVIAVLTQEVERLHLKNRKLLKDLVTAQWEFEDEFATLILHRGARETSKVISMTAWFYKYGTLDVMRESRDVKLSNKFTRFLKEFGMDDDINYVSLANANGVSLSHDSDHDKCCRFFLSDSHCYGEGIYLSEKEGLNIIRQYMLHVDTGIVKRIDRFPHTGPAVPTTMEDTIDSDPEYDDVF